jgi:hypothetical protein
VLHFELHFPDYFGKFLRKILEVSLLGKTKRIPISMSDLDPDWHRNVKSPATWFLSLNLLLANAAICL